MYLDSSHWDWNLGVCCKCGLPQLPCTACISDRDSDIVVVLEEYESDIVVVLEEYESDCIADFCAEKGTTFKDHLPRGFGEHPRAYISERLSMEKAPFMYRRECYVKSGPVEQVVFTGSLIPVKIFGARFGNKYVNVIRISEQSSSWQMFTRQIGSKVYGKTLLGRVKQTRGGRFVFTPYKGQKTEQDILAKYKECEKRTKTWFISDRYSDEFETEEESLEIDEILKMKKFQVGDKVTAANWPYSFPKMLNTNDSYSVCAVRKVPRSSVLSTGHPQFVSIMIDGELDEYSGAFFV